MTKIHIAYFRVCPDSSHIFSDVDPEHCLFDSHKDSLEGPKLHQKPEAHLENIHTMSNIKHYSNFRRSVFG